MSFDRVLLVAACAALFFVRLDHPPLWDDDETRFASVGREMVRTGDWVVPRFNGELADKPPLIFWMIAAAFSVFGESAGAARLGSAIFASLAVLATWRIAAMLYGRAVAVWSAVVLATSLMFVAEARLATTDMALLAFVTISVAVAVDGWWRGGKPNALPDCSGRLGAGRALLIGVFAGAGILTKGLAALLLPVLTLWLFAWWMAATAGRNDGVARKLSQGWCALLSLRPVLIVVGAALVAGTWHFLVWQRTDGDWLRLFYMQHYVGRIAFLQPLTGVAMRPPEGHQGFPLIQVASLLAGLFPWSVFLPLAAWRALRTAANRSQAPRAAEKLLFVWVAVWVGAVSLSSTQLPHYVFPAFPAASIMIAALVTESFLRPGSLKTGWFYAAAGGLAFGGAAIAVGGFFAGRWLDIPALSGAAWIGAIPLIVAVAFAHAARSGARLAAVRIFAGGAFILQCAAVFVAAPVVARANPLPAMLDAAVESSGGRARLATFRFSAPGVVWLSGGAVRVCASSDEVAAFFKSGRDAFAVIDAASCAEVAAALGSEPRVMMRGRPLSRRDEIALLGPEDPR